MTTHNPPDWVGDAVFYQVFPDRFARTRDPSLVDASVYGPPGRLEPWDAPPTPHGFKGGDLFGIAERIDELADLGINAIYLNPIFASARPPFGSSPPSSPISTSRIVATRFASLWTRA